MAQFEGFREGCPGRITIGDEPYIHTIVKFQADGVTLWPSDAGEGRPDAIRIVRVDDYQASVWQDKVLAFDADTAERQTELKDGQIPEGNVITLDQTQLEELNAGCRSCTLTSGESCPVLEAAMKKFVNVQPVE